MFSNAVSVLIPLSMASPVALICDDQEAELRVDATTWLDAWHYFRRGDQSSEHYVRVYHGAL